MLGSHGAETMVEVIRAYQELDHAGELGLRISAHIPLPQWQRLGQAPVMANFNSGRLQIGAVKSFSDGSLGSTTAWFFDPYSDAPHTCGLPSDELLDEENMYRNLRDADRAGLQLVIHAIEIAPTASCWTCAKNLCGRMAAATGASVSSMRSICVRRTLHGLPVIGTRAAVDRRAPVAENSLLRMGREAS